MSFNKLGEIIRTEVDAFKTPNITEAFASDKSVEIYNENFRLSKKGIEHFLFFSYLDQLYYPVWFEFRSINNNVLFLIEEFSIDSFELLQRILNSSLQKEEGMQATMKAIVFHTKNQPPYSHLLTNFKIEPSLRIDIHE